ncbi:uncharacterized protein LOC142582750 isoform X2 [Dermacentor variabilis]|uniref:uncharacterized protein LOC142582750 isoform X2 n=1 Tax=Dermacentor variabilis TaxID=34621 RepID=UPI003F5C6A51
MDNGGTIVCSQNQRAILPLQRTRQQISELKLSSNNADRGSSVGSASTGTGPSEEEVRPGCEPERRRGDPEPWRRRRLPARAHSRRGEKDNVKVQSGVLLHRGRAHARALPRRALTGTIFQFPSLQP